MTAWQAGAAASATAAAAASAQGGEIIPSYVRYSNGVLSGFPVTASWAAMPASSSGLAVLIYSGTNRIAFQASGVFGVDGEVSLEGSNDGLNFEILSDASDNPLTLASPGMLAPAALPSFIRPVVAGGDGSTSITAVAVMRP